MSRYRHHGDQVVGTLGRDGRIRTRDDAYLGDEEEPGAEFVMELDDDAADCFVTRREDGVWDLWRHESDANQTDLGADLQRTKSARSFIERGGGSRDHAITRARHVAQRAVDTDRLRAINADSRRPGEEADRQAAGGQCAEAVGSDEG